MYYWRDIDTIAPRRPARTHQNIKVRQPGRNQQISEPRSLEEPLHEEPPLQEEPLREREPAVQNGGTATPEHNWQETAQRLQAEMDNFRKRQERRADEAIAREKERLLSLFLPAVDNLTRALAHQNGPQMIEPEKSVRQGVELTQRELMRALAAEGVTQLETVGQPFDPAWHEAVATVPAGVEPGTIVEQIEAGYKLGDKLLRPAKVVVAA